MICGNCYSTGCGITVGNGDYTQIPLTLCQEFLNRIIRYAMDDATVKPMQEAVTVGIQKKTTLNALLSSRLAAKKIANEEIAKIHDRGQRTLPLTIAIIKSIPVACAWLGLSTHQIVRSSVTIMAAIPLRMALT